MRPAAIRVGRNDQQRAQDAWDLIISLVLDGISSRHTVFTIVTAYADMLGMVVRPHDLRRTFAKLAYIGESPLEQIQFSLGHASVVTTELYLGTKQNLEDAPCDRLGLDAISRDTNIGG